MTPFRILFLNFLVVSFLILSILTSQLGMLFNAKFAIAQENISIDRGHKTGQEWTMEIDFRNLIDKYPEENLGTRHLEYKFTGNLEFEIIECKGSEGEGEMTEWTNMVIETTSMQCIDGSGKGEVFVKEEHRNSVQGYCWSGAEGPVTFSLAGTYAPQDIPDSPENETNRIALGFLDGMVQEVGQCIDPETGDTYPNERGSVVLGMIGIPSDITDRFGRIINYDPPRPIGSPFPLFELKDGAEYLFEADESYLRVTLHGPDCETKPEPPKFDVYTSGLWRATFGVVEQEGLVLQDINIGNNHLLNKLSMPHSKVELSNGKEHYVRYCSSTDKHSDPQISGDSIRWSFTRLFDMDTPSRSDDATLTISYNFVIRSGSVQNCEDTPLTKSITCLRFIPMVSFRWDGSTAGILKQFTAYYKLDYGHGTGLVLVKDSLSDLPAGLRQFQEKEILFNAVRDGVGGRFDNIHTGHVGDYVNIPGCRASSMYDCLHMHWRWASIVDPLVDPVNNENDAFPASGGDPYLVPGQTIDIAVVKASSVPSEEDPDEPSALVTGDVIAVNALGKAEGCPRVDGAYLKSAEHPIVWYISSVENKISTTFFKHGLFSLDTR